MKWIDEWVQLVSLREHGLGDNADVLLTTAYSLYFSCKWKEAIAVTTNILRASPNHFHTRELHISLLFDLNDKNRLFAYAHELVAKAPGWYSMTAWGCVWISVFLCIFCICVCVFF
jgi:hypothetical protein